MSGTTDKAQALAEEEFSNSQILDKREKYEYTCDGGERIRR